MLGVPCYKYFFGICHLVGFDEHNKIIIFLHARESYAAHNPMQKFEE
jgi:hypothetical protein